MGEMLQHFPFKKLLLHNFHFNNGFKGKILLYFFSFYLALLQQLCNKSVKWGRRG